ncbi:ZPR1 zinc-finger domain containing protein [Babesia bovis T2Bo]|uniref:ZPR1 zinc-finger domain containing protein n=1 Tax=Babesia bovis TaxID=5865 RepID=A7AQF4_BABBO|nr:ZPR1 zinc-finger domain containing protein [Babesia bovis T2Bo]EDO06773.1 ZPR1 zinc-finger domain containing protein [Babesia bovis T2Bo]|eukprot:XP_001610341.1 ZPR1 zinc-finger domain containing protein [Babesia bovis T2Bo]
MADSAISNVVTDAAVTMASDRASVESLCVQCGAMGITMVLMHMIPHFKEVILMSFECPSCGYRNSELQDAAPLQDYGLRLKAHVAYEGALRNQVVLSGTTSCRIEEIDFEFQPTMEKGTVTTIEGYLMRLAGGLGDHISSIADAMRENPGIIIEMADGKQHTAAEYLYSLNSIKQSLIEFSEGDKPFTLILDDPAGNTYIEETQHLSVESTRYNRSPEQQEMLGYIAKEDDKKEIDLTTPIADDDDVGKEGLSLPVDCPHCGKVGNNKICEVLVPGFGPCVIMAFTCENCGAKSNEIKPGGGYKEHARKWTLKVQDVTDLNRDVIISETATIHIPLLELDMTAGTIGAVYTTVEGMLIKHADSLETAYPFLLGDSADPSNTTLKDKVRQLRALASGEFKQPYEIIIDDPADHSFVGARNGASGDDSNLRSETYQRTAEQNDLLGLTDMVTENY